MLHYRLSFPEPTQQLIQVTLTAKLSAGRHHWQLPLWRPGRYARQDFDKRIADLRCQTNQGDPLALRSISTHRWELHLEHATDIRLSYAFLANQQDAGGSYVDQDLVYINPINLILYQPGQEDQPCTLSLDLPDDYLIGGGLPGQGPDYDFSSIHQLLDTPFVASANLQCHEFSQAGLPIYVWVQGLATLDLPRLEQDICSYSQTQLDLFGDCPVDEYHYLYLFWPHRNRHGVEHHNSTVITLGPGMKLHQPEMYKSLLEISSHEFFHTWNVKALRPADMYPYDYSREMYSELHYVTEGVTTYYGDLMLWKSGIWDWEAWLRSINGELERHYRMAGKDHTTLAQASLSSWVNGYALDGFPHRRISFYTKGYLVALLTDTLIRRHSDGDHSLDDVMYQLYQDVSKAGRGYQAEDYLQRVAQAAGTDISDFAQAYLYGTEPLEPALQALAQDAGLVLTQIPAADPVMDRLGLQCSPLPGGSLQVESIWPGSPALQTGIHPGDELVTINGQRLRHNLADWLELLPREGNIALGRFHLDRWDQCSLPLGSGFGSTPQFISMAAAPQRAQAFRQQWRQVGGAARHSQATV